MPRAVSIPPLSWHEAGTKIEESAPGDEQNAPLTPTGSVTGAALAEEDDEAAADGASDGDAVEWSDEHPATAPRHSRAPTTSPRRTATEALPRAETDSV